MIVRFGSLNFALTLMALGALTCATGCTTDDGDNEGASGSEAKGGSATAGGGATSGAATGGSSGSGGGGGSVPTDAVCANPIAIPSETPGIADFDEYDGASELATWSFPLGGDSATGVYAGPFGYGDREDGAPETFEMSEGDGSGYAMRIADSMAMEYGGGQGLWLSACVDASAFTGISFWARGDAPSGTVLLTLAMQETTPETPAKAEDKIGTCSGDSTTCLHPKLAFEVSDTWTEIKAPWADFMPGDAAGSAVEPDGRNIVQLQFGVDLSWVEGDDGVYVPVPAPYELAVDTLSFY
jgi:hypothetical protein